MTRGWRIATGAIALAVLAGIAAALLIVHSRRQKPITLVGAVIQQASDAREETPIADVEISAAGGLAADVTQSNFSGLFRLTLKPGIRLGQAITLVFRHAGYMPLAVPTFVGNQLYIARMVPLQPQPMAGLVRPSVIVSNVLVRYSVESTTAPTIGTAAKTFQVINRGNMPCNHHFPCSPDGKWKAAVSSASLDAGKGNIFANPRVSCIAGPCPFTRIDSEVLSQDGRVVTVKARCWSDTTTFLLQAEVVHPEVGDAVEEAYPVIFGRAMNFSLPANAQGPSLEATLNGVQIIFPLPPSLDLSWVSCKVSPQNDQTKLYRCVLKPIYKF